MLLLTTNYSSSPTYGKNVAAHILNRTCAHARAAQDVDKESAEAVEAAAAATAAAK